MHYALDNASRHSSPRKYFLCTTRRISNASRKASMIAVMRLKRIRQPASTLFGVGMTAERKFALYAQDISHLLWRVRQRLAALQLTGRLSKARTCRPKRPDGGGAPIRGRAGLAPAAAVLC